MKQHTPEWVEARLGMATASCAEHWMATLKDGGAPAGRKAYLASLVLQRLNHAPLPTYQSAAMLYGIELEDDARAAYAFARNVDVIECGFFHHPRIKMAGASPDGLVGADGLVEIKCPQPHTHLDTLMRGTIALRYLYQMQFQLAVTDRRWVDFVSYDKNYPEPMRLVIIRIERDSDEIERLEKACVKFLAEVDDAVRFLYRRFPMLEAA